MTDPRELAQTVWDGLSDAEKADLMTSDQASGELLRRMTDVGPLSVGVRWKSSEDPGYTFVIPPALEIIEHELHLRREGIPPWAR
jgi:hypothetical protein